MRGQGVQERLDKMEKMETIRRLLVLDNSRVVRATLSKHLKDDFEVIEEASGESAWQTLMLDSGILLYLTRSLTVSFSTLFKYVFADFMTSLVITVVEVTDSLSGLITIIAVCEVPVRIS